MSRKVNTYCLFALLLIPIFLFNLGIQSFHDCDTLIHQHDEVSFEAGHNDCIVCEAKLHPFEDIQFTHIVRFESAYALNTKTTIPKIQKQALESASNKGPPALA